MKDKLAFPSQEQGAMKDEFSTNFGMTYKEWLIGQILGGIFADRQACGNRWKDTANNAIKLADEVIKQLEQ